MFSEPNAIKKKEQKPRTNTSSKNMNIDGFFSPQNKGVSVSGIKKKKKTTKLQTKRANTNTSRHRNIN
jgi:hypothetical protein